MKNYSYKCVVSKNGKRYYKNVNGKWKRISNKVGMKAEKGKKRYGMNEPKNTDKTDEEYTQDDEINSDIDITKFESVDEIVAKEIEAIEIGEMVLNHLKDINEVAYIRFASVYRQFHGIDDFIKTLESLKPLKKEQFASVI